MGLITDTTVKTFDLSVIHRGDAIRVRRAGDSIGRNGIVTKLTDNYLVILYSNTQNTSTSFLKIAAAEVAAGGWEIYWTSDFVTVNCHHMGDGPSEVCGDA